MFSHDALDSRDLQFSPGRCLTTSRDFVVEPNEERNVESFAPALPPHYGSKSSTKQDESILLF